MKVDYDYNANTITHTCLEGGIAMYNVELAFRIGDTNGYKCRRCGRLLGAIDDGAKHSDSGFEEWNFCPYCSMPLDMQLNYEEE